VVADRRIARALNAEGVASPRARALRDRRPSWAPTAIREMLRSPIYKGERIFNRSEWIKDHETGRRRRHERPESEWVRRHDEALRIVSDELWESVQARRRSLDGIPVFPRRADGRLQGGVPGQTSSRASHLLGGLLACGTCGGAFFAVTRGSVYGCGWHRDRGPDVCASRLRVRRTEIEDRVLDALRTRVFTEEMIAPAVDRAIGKLVERLRGPNAEAARKRLRELEHEIENATQLAIRAGNVEAVARALQTLEAERVDCERRIEASRPIVLDPSVLRARVARYAADLRSALDRAPEAGRSVLQRLLAGRRIAVHEDAQLGFRVEGAFDLSLEMTSARLPQEAGRLAPVVAGVGFEPTTSGL